MGPIIIQCCIYIEGFHVIIPLAQQLLYIYPPDNNFSLLPPWNNLLD